MLSFKITFDFIWSKKRTSKYTMAALETKLESYEKEVKQLQKALDKSDKYIADLEQKSRDKENNNKSLTVYNNGSTTNKQTTSPHNANNSYNLLNSNSSTNLNAESMMTSPPVNIAGSQIRPIVVGVLEAYTSRRLIGRSGFVVIIAPLPASETSELP